MLHLVKMLTNDNFPSGGFLFLFVFLVEFIISNVEKTASVSLSSATFQPGLPSNGRTNQGKIFEESLQTIDYEIWDSLVPLFAPTLSVSPTEFVINRWHLRALQSLPQ
jgi:hypothetical protein